MFNSDFWEKILPRFHSPKSLLARIQRGELETKETKENLLNDLKNLVETLEETYKNAPPHSLISSLHSLTELCTLLLKVSSFQIHSH